MSRALRTLAAIAVVCGMLTATACTPDPAPTPTPTGFSSEAEAFAAAEATYRAYVDALNRVDLADPATFEPVFALTTGELNDLDRMAFSDYHARGIEMTGALAITSITSETWTASEQTVQLDACLDVSRVDFLDQSGESLVTDDRAPIQAQSVFLSADATRTIHIARIIANDGASCAS